MRQTITISLPATVRRELDRMAKSDGLSRSDIVRESLRDYLFIRQFRSLRGKIIAAARAQGQIYTDQEIFDRVS
jgi:metal-responsive CopG/Arc/MetJ family transcriptional regulator